jgi:hypothetical protein
MRPPCVLHCEACSTVPISLVWTWPISEVNYMYAAVQLFMTQLFTVLRSSYPGGKQYARKTRYPTMPSKPHKGPIPSLGTADTVPGRQECTHTSSASAASLPHCTTYPSSSAAAFAYLMQCCGTQLTLSSVCSLMVCLLCCPHPAVPAAAAVATGSGSTAYLSSSAPASS